MWLYFGAYWSAWINLRWDDFMGKQCISCGKNIGLLTVRIPLLENEDLVICAECFEKMPSILDDLYQKRIHPTKTELLTIKEEIIQQLKILNYNQDSINVITKFLDNKIEKAKDPENSENGKLLKKCPVCKKNVNYDTEICSDCGFAFNVMPVIEYKEIAKIYNERLEQYKRNPFYEYDYIVVPNKSDGSTNKESIEDIIRNHAMQGWRLVTMYSNETGKNAITVGGVGSNVTICEDIIIFERCIKEAEESEDKKCH